jgi:DNA-binding NarL/FixJ family response regulator
MVRSALRILLEQGHGLQIVGEVGDAEGLLAQAKTTNPDLVLLDWELPGLQAAGSLPALRRLCPDLFVIALSGRPEARSAALAAQADSFVSKGEPPDRLLCAIGDCKCGQAGE